MESRSAVDSPLPLCCSAQALGANAFCSGCSLVVVRAFLGLEAVDGCRSGVRGGCQWLHSGQKGNKTQRPGVKVPWVLERTCGPRWTEESSYSRVVSQQSHSGDGSWGRGCVYVSDLGRRV